MQTLKYKHNDEYMEINVIGENDWSSSIEAEDGFLDLVKAIHKFTRLFDTYEVSVVIKKDTEQSVGLTD